MKFLTTLFLAICLLKGIDIQARPYSHMPAHVLSTEEAEMRIEQMEEDKKTLENFLEMISDSNTIGVRTVHDAFVPVPKDLFSQSLLVWAILEDKGDEDISVAIRQASDAAIERQMLLKRFIADLDNQIRDLRYRSGMSANTQQ